MPLSYSLIIYSPSDGTGGIVSASSHLSFIQPHGDILTPSFLAGGSGCATCVAASAHANVTDTSFSFRGLSAVTTITSMPEPFPVGDMHFRSLDIGRRQYRNHAWCEWRGCCSRPSRTLDMADDGLGLGRDWLHGVSRQAKAGIDGSLIYGSPRIRSSSASARPVVEIPDRSEGPSATGRPRLSVQRRLPRGDRDAEGLGRGAVRNSCAVSSGRCHAGSDYA